VFQQQAQAYMFSSPVVAGQVLLIGQLNGTLQARDGTTGALLWQFTTDAARRNAGWVLTADGRFNSAWLFDSDSYESMVIGFHRQSSVGSFFSTPLVVDGAIYIGSADGRMYALRQRRRAAAARAAQRGRGGPGPPPSPGRGHHRGGRLRRPHRQPPAHRPLSGYRCTS